MSASLGERISGARFEQPRAGARRATAFDDAVAEVRNYVQAERNTHLKEEEEAKRKETRGDRRATAYGGADAVPTGRLHLLSPLPRAGSGAHSRPPSQRQVVR